MSDPEKKGFDSASGSDKNDTLSGGDHAKYATKDVSSDDEHKPNLTSNINAKLANPLAGLSRKQLRDSASSFCREHGLEDYESEMQKGALIAQDPLIFEQLDDLDEEDKNVLRREMTHRWDQPRMLYFMTVMCSVAAAVQGMDESVINGALLQFPYQFGIGMTTPQSVGDKNSWIKGLIGSSPYLCCAFIGCWLTEPMNSYFGRRGTIFITATLSALTCFWSGVTNSWPHLVASRLVLGLGIGPKSATVPVYAAECAPPLIRGALVMQWQTWTAFGIMLGYVSCLIFYQIPWATNFNSTLASTDPTYIIDYNVVNGIRGLSWRFMLASAGLPAVFVAAQVFICPESPRWLMKKGRYAEALQSFCRLRNSRLQACRDLYFAHCLLVEEAQIKRGRWPILELFTVPRNARATLASTIVMFGQQFCGVNVIAYYSSSILSESGLSDINALLGSFGFGALNFLFAIPAWYTIDTFGRRNLLLVTYPFLALTLLLTGFSFFIPYPEMKDARLGVVLLGIYLYAIAYSPGMGPVPFVYSAEAFPLYIREIGMGYATAVLWFFNAVLSITFFRLERAFTPQGAFGWYAAWCIVLWVLVYFFLPETSRLSLEELDMVFAVPTHKHAGYHLKGIPYFIQKYLFRRKVTREPLYQVDPHMQRTSLPVGGAA